MLNVDEKSGYVYFYASPVNATQQYLYRTKLDGKGKSERVSPAGEEGTHQYDISPNGKFARHSFSNYYTAPLNEWVTLPDHKPFKAEDDISKKIKRRTKRKVIFHFFKVTTEEGYDGWMGNEAKEF